MMKYKIIATSSSFTITTPSLLATCKREVNLARDAYFQSNLTNCISHYHNAIDTTLSIVKKRFNFPKEVVDQFSKSVRVSSRDFLAYDFKDYIGEIMPSIKEGVRKGKRLIFVTGPTSSGKNSISVHIREELLKKGLDVQIKDADYFFKRVHGKPKPREFQHPYIKFISDIFHFDKAFSSLKKLLRQSDSVFIVPIYDVIMSSFPFQKCNTPYQIVELSSQNSETKDYNTKTFRNYLFRHPTDLMVEKKYPRILHEIVGGQAFDLTPFKTWKPDIYIDQSKGSVKYPDREKKLNLSTCFVSNPFWSISAKKSNIDLEEYSKNANILPIYDYWLGHKELITA